MFGSNERDPKKSAYCDECYAVIPHGKSTCSRCDTPAQRTGWLARTAAWIVKRLVNWAPANGVVKTTEMSSNRRARELPPAESIVEAQIVEPTADLASELPPAVQEAMKSGRTVTVVSSKTVDEPSTKGRIFKARVVRSTDDFVSDLPPMVQEAMKSGRSVVTITDGSVDECQTFDSWPEVSESLKQKLSPKMLDTIERIQQSLQKSDERIISLKQAFNSEDLFEKFKSGLPTDLHERIKAELDEIIEDARDNR